jgi:hypothetical protein
MLVFDLKTSICQNTAGWIGRMHILQVLIPFFLNDNNSKQNCKLLTYFSPILHKTELENLHELVSFFELSSYPFGIHFIF